MHEELLNKMLSNTCGVERAENDIRLFVLDLHCMEVWIVAKMVVDTLQEEIKYNIISYRFASYSTNTEMRDWASNYGNFSPDKR